MKLSALKTDRLKEDQGTWIDAGAGLRLKVARAGNFAYADCLRKLVRQKLAAVRVGELDSKTNNELTCLALSQHVLLGWENLQDDDGKDILYTPAKACELLLANTEFYKMVFEVSTDVSNFRESEIKTAAKN